MHKKSDQYEWPRVIEVVQETLVLTKAQIALKCGVTEQSISNWSNMTRTPTGCPKEKLLDLLKETGLETSTFIRFDTGSSNPLENYPKDVRELVRTLRELPPSKRQDIIEMGTLLMKSLQN